MVLYHTQEPCDMIKEISKRVPLGCLTLLKVAALLPFTSSLEDWELKIRHNPKLKCHIKKSG